MLTPVHGIHMNLTYIHRMNMIDESKIDFHESSITKFFKEQNNISIVVENARYVDKFKTASLILKNITLIETEAKISSDNFMAAEDGEIIFLELHPTNTTFVVEWNDYKKNLHFKYGYNIEFEMFDISLTWPLV